MNNVESAAAAPILVFIHFPLSSVNLAIITGAIY